MPLPARTINPSSEPFFNIMGPVVQFLLDPADASGAFGLIRGIVPPGVAVPLHSHADPEAMYVLNGSLEFLQYSEHSSRWLMAQSDEIICIPGEVKHALGNSSSKPATVLLATTPNIYEFFRELASPFEPDRPVGPPTPEDMQRLLTLSAKHNYWIASPEENAAIGLNALFARGVRD